MNEKYKPAAGLKRKDIKACVICGQGMMHRGDITFYRFSVQQFIFLPRNIQRAQGLEMMVGHPAIAAALGLDEDLAQAPCPADIGLICMDCALMKGTTIGALISALGETEQTDESRTTEAKQK